MEELIFLLRLIKLPQKELATRMGVQSSYLSRVMRFHNIPSKDFKQKMFNALHEEVEKFLDKEMAAYLNLKERAHGLLKKIEDL